MKNKSGLVFVLAMTLMLSACGGHAVNEATSPTETPKEETSVATPAPTVAPASSESSVAGMSAERAVSLAERCMENKDEISAVQFYSYAISQRPDNAALYMARGECYTRIAERCQASYFYSDEEWEYNGINISVPFVSSVISPAVVNPASGETWCAQEDYRKAAELGSDEAKSKLEELAKDRPVLLYKWEASDNPYGDFYVCYGYNEYGSVVDHFSVQDGGPGSGSNHKAFFSTELDVSELEAKAEKIEAGQVTDTTLQTEITYDAQGRCTRIERMDGTVAEYLYNEKGQPEYSTEYDSDGELTGHTKYVYNPDGTISMVIHNWSVILYEYVPLSQAQNSDELKAKYDEIDDRIAEKKTEALKNLAVFPGTTPPEEVFAYTELLSWTTTAEHGLVLRAAPDTNAEKLTTIPLDSEILQVGKTASATGWAFVWYKGQYGWVSTQYLKGGEIYVPEWRW